MRLYVAVVVLAACGGSTPPAPDAANLLCFGDPGPLPLPPTFGNVLRIFGARCALCHGPGVPLDLHDTGAYAQLVGRAAPDWLDPATPDSCGGVLVTPGDLAASYLDTKLTSDTPCAGLRMPRTEVGGSGHIDPCEIDLIERWILAGAPNN